MTQPTEGDNRKMCETDEGSMSLSCSRRQYTLCSLARWCGIVPYRHLLLRDDYRTVLAPHAQ